jgi:hypothetical protein
MKRILFCFLFFLGIAGYSEDLQWIVIQNAQIKTYNSSTDVIIPKGTVVDILDNEDLVYQTGDDVDITYKGKSYLISVENVAPVNTVDTIEKFVKMMNEKTYYYSFFINILQSQNRDTALKYETKAIKYREEGLGEFDPHWWQSDIHKSLKINNVSIVIQGLGYDGAVFFIKKITLNSSGYDVVAQLQYYNIKDYFSTNNNYIEKGHDVKLLFRNDGDYLNIYLNTTNTILGTFVHVDKEFINQFDNLIHNNICDLSKVTWPRHADGTCDYDGSAKRVPSAPSSSSISVSGTTKRVTTNLRLRSTQDTSSTVITTMQKGTAVKIIKTGGKDTIDGIASNWVQVEVQAGAKDRDGKSITAGTTGWCFGGYLE